MIRKSTIALLLTLIAIVLGFDSFLLTPLGFPTRILGIGISTMGFILLFVFYRQFPKQLRQFAILLLVLFVQSIYSTYSIFGQSLYSGFIASSTIYLSGIALFIYYLITKYNIDFDLLKKRILLLSWIFFIALTLVFLSGMKFQSTASPEDVFGIDSLKKGIINLGSIIYLTHYFKKNHLKYLLFSVILFSINHMEDFQRYIFFVYVTCIIGLIIAYRQRSTSTRILVVIAFLIPLGMLILPTTKFGQEISKKMESAFELFESEKQDFSDHSVEARILESEYAIESIMDHPVTGVGLIRSSEKERIIKIDYFFVSDIGLIGIAFSFGILGIFIFIKQGYYFYFVLDRIKMAKDMYASEFRLFILFILVHTIVTGRSLNTAADFLMMLALIEIGHARQLSEEDASE